MKLNIHLYYGPEIPLLVIYPTDIKICAKKTLVEKKINSNFTHNNSKLRTTQISISMRMDKQILIDLYNGIWFSNRNKHII